VSVATREPVVAAVGVLAPFSGNLVALVPQQQRGGAAAAAGGAAAAAADALCAYINSDAFRMTRTTEDRRFTLGSARAVALSLTAAAARCGAP
jgi:hypothetical protein